MDTKHLRVVSKICLIRITFVTLTNQINPLQDCLHWRVTALGTRLDAQILEPPQSIGHLVLNILEALIWGTD